MKLTVKSYQLIRFSVHLIARILIVLLCFIQMWSITVDFIGGDTISKVYLHQPQVISLPSISLCFPLFEILNQSKIYSEHAKCLSQSKGKNNLEENVIIDFVTTTKSHLASQLVLIIGNMTLKQLNENLKNLDNIIELIEPAPITSLADYNGDSSIDNNKINCSIKRYLKEPTVCLIVTCYFNGETVFYSHNSLISPDQHGTMLKIGLNENIVSINSALALILTTPGQLARDQGYVAFHISFDKQPQTWSVSFDTLINNLLEEYETDCQWYNKSGFESRDHAYQNCINSGIVKLFGATFYGTSKRFDDPSQVHLKSGYYSYYREFLNPNREQSSADRQLCNQIRQKCDQLYYRRHCRLEYYTPHGYGIHRRDRSYYTIILKTPDKPITENSFFPEYELFDYLIYLGSALSFWFGFSLFDLNKVAIQSFFNWINRKHCSSDTISIPSQSSSISLVVNSSQTKVKRKQGFKHKLPRVIQICNIKQ